MNTILVIVHLFLSIGLIGLILIQHGKGADAGAAFGSGASSTVFGARGSANFLSRTTGVLALLFFITSLTLAWLAMETARDSGLMIDVQSTETQPIPAAESDLPTIPEVANDSEAPAAPAETAPAAAATGADEVKTDPKSE
ncbi:preprotein translocase subunit SecG [Thiolapillus sp.]